MHCVLHNGWRFCRLPLGSSLEEARGAGPRGVDMPHDWLIYQADRLYEDGCGWYFYPLTLSGEQAQSRVVLHFDGVYQDADVLLNGEKLMTHRYGYTPFFVDLSGKVRPGENELCVCVRYQAPNSRWYSGAGIFRDVTLYVTEPYALLPDGVSVRTDFDENGDCLVSVDAECCGEPRDALVSAVLLAPDGSEVFSQTKPAASVNTFSVLLHAPKRWDIDSPQLYTLRLSVPGDTLEKRIGLRETVFSPDKGFFLNGRHLKLQGVCLHHDLGLLGAAFHEDAARRQLRVMMEMGVNAVRTAHNPPAEKLLDLCDEMGLMVMDELYDMWEMPKTTYDNARFFPETYPEDVAAYVRRDRCHPCVILWSIGNEIQDMHVSARGQEWTRKLMEEVRRHDRHHAPVTFGSNYMPWEGAQKCADIVKLPGYNYAEKHYEEHHRLHPDWVIFGSETASLLQSRGIYHFPADASILAEEDLQCSELLNSRTSWGIQDLPAMLTADRVNPFTLGQFVWAGIDYIGEPTPYHTRSCYFGQTDTACFPKDSYYLYQAFWTNKPVVHIGGIWDWNEGQLIDVPVMTNTACCELFLNGVSLGKKPVDLTDEKHNWPMWKVAFTPGTLEAVGYDDKGLEIGRDIRTSFGDSVRLRLRADRGEIMAGGIAAVTVTAEDQDGRPVLNANDRVHMTVSGAGVLLGLDNGDSTDPDGYRTDCRRLFSGRLLAMAGALNEEGEIRFCASAEGLEPAEITVRVRRAEGSAPVFTALSACPPARVLPGRDIRKIQLDLGGEPISLGPRTPSRTIRVKALPEDARPQPLSFRAVNAQGVTVPFARVEAQGDCVTITGLGDGVCYLRAAAANGEDHPRILSQLECRLSGFGAVSLDPYSLISGSLYDVHKGEITPGNEQGIAFAREGWSLAGFSHVDFGPVGSDEIVLPVFALNDERYMIGVWDGVPDEGGEKLADLAYQKPSIWNVYQEETYRLPRVLRGLHTLCFSMDQKVHLKGFRFIRQSRAFRGDSALHADQVYGDSFERTKDAVRHIGNNVSLLFEHMDFGEGGPVRLLLDGQTAHEKDAVTVHIRAKDGTETVETCLFEKRADRTEQPFCLTAPRGECGVTFVFLPGSDFDFYGFRFERAE